MNILVVIPARGGSKGIPRKNIRLLDRKPLIYYSIKTALSSKFDLDIYVSSDDDEILNISEKFGAKIHKRCSNIAEDATTLDPVIYNCYLYAKNNERKEYDYIVTIQPTSPLLNIHSLDLAIEKIIKNQNIDTIISAKNDTHLSWKKVNNKFIPTYTKRVNRQELPPLFTETGGFLITKKECINNQTRIGNNIDLYILNGKETIDIDNYEDWNLCEYYLKQKRILFVVTGNNEVGLGHIYNTLAIANDILNHEIIFLVDINSQLGYDKVASRNYPVFMQKNINIIDDIQLLNPDIIINDKLDTDFNYITQLKQLNLKVINFEDLGDGAKRADAVINAIYPEDKKIPNHFYGPQYFILRDEFLYSQLKEVTEPVCNVLLTFGGVDPNNYTKKVIDAIYDYCAKRKINLTVITGFGYEKHETLNSYEDVHILKNITDISVYMLQADIIFTSAGRTIYEIASINTPAIVMAQNERELTHFFASENFGFLNLGLGYNLSESQILSNFVELCNNFSKRKTMSALMKQTNLKDGRKTVVKIINKVIEG